MNNHKNSGGNTMSLNKSATRRLSLLAGSSLVAASLSAAASLGAAITPTAAIAAATCAPPPSTGAGTNSVTYTGTVYATGIDCDSGGPMTVSVTTNSVDIGGAGIMLTGTGADSVTFTGPTTSSSAEIDGVGLTGALLDIATGSGSIVVNAGALDADQATANAMTHGLRAASATGDITVTLTSTVDAEASGGNVNGVAGVLATTGGAGSIGLTTSSVQGRLYGIRAEVAGTGNLTINAGNSTVSAHATAGLAGIHAKAGTGTLTLSGNGTAASGYGVYVDAGGDIVFSGGGTGLDYGVYIKDIAAGSTATVRLGNATGGLAGLLAQGAGDLVIDITSQISKVDVNVTGMAGRTPITFQPGGIWRAVGAARGPSGDYELTISEGAGLVSSDELTTQGGANVGVFEPATIITFAGSEGLLINNGVIIVGPGEQHGHGNDEHEAELRFIGLPEFQHAGRMFLGTANSSGESIGGFSYRLTDSRPDDHFVMEGGAWVGQGGEIVYDINSNLTQTSCTRDANGDFAAADCVSLPGVTTEGVTYLSLVDALPGDRGRLNETGIVLVDVSGGESAQGHFVVGPNTPGYSPAFGGSLDKGIFHYVVAYDETTQQHKLVSIVGGNTYQAPILAGSAQALWRTSTGTWLGRQADLRGGLEDGIGGGVWLRATAEFADRDIISSSTAGGQTFDFDNTLTENSYAVMGGVDLATGSGGEQAYVVGLMAGYVHSDVDYEASPNTARFNGGSLGGYASFVSGGLFVDAAVNAHRLTLRQDLPGLNLFPAGSLVSTKLISVGAQVETGWRFPVGAAFVEPLAGVSYVRSKYDDMLIVPDDPGRPGLEIAYDDPTSLRGSVGGRVGIDNDFGFVRTQVSLLGRVSNEFEGENSIVLHNAAFPTDPDVTLTDDFSGRFNELSVGASVWSPGGIVSGFLNVGGRFADDYEAKNASVGVRVAW